MTNTNINLNKAIEEIAKANTQYYLSDVTYDMARLTLAKEGDTFLWLSRSHGTLLLPETEVCKYDSPSYTAWQYYEEDVDKVKAFHLKITQITEGHALGIITPINYTQHQMALKENAVTPDSVAAFLSDGTVLSCTWDEYMQDSKQFRRNTIEKWLFPTDRVSLHIAVMTMRQIMGI